MRRKDNGIHALRRLQPEKFKAGIHIPCPVVHSRQYVCVQIRHDSASSPDASSGDFVWLL